jgi:hypothetical protein
VIRVLSGRTGNQIAEIEEQRQKILTAKVANIPQSALRKSLPNAAVIRVLSGRTGNQIAEIEEQRQKILTAKVAKIPQSALRKSLPTRRGDSGAVRADRSVRPTRAH